MYIFINVIPIRRRLVYAWNVYGIKLVFLATIGSTWIRYRSKGLCYLAMVRQTAAEGGYIPCARRSREIHKQFFSTVPGNCLLEIIENIACELDPGWIGPDPKPVSRRVC